MADRWERVTEQRVRASTMHGYRASLRFARTWMGPIDVRDITAAMLSEMEADLIGISDLSPLYARNARNVAIMVLGHAEEAGMIRSVPRGRRRKVIRGPQKPRRYLSSDQLKAALAVPDPYASAFRLAAMTGLRAGELLALEHTDLVDDQVRIRRNLNRYGAIDPFTKSKAGHRDIDVPPEAAALLPAHEGRCWPVSYQTLLHHWHEVLREAGIAQAGLHVLRHTNASLRIRLGQDLVYIADQLGHSDASITLREYGHLLEAEPRDASALGALIPPGPA